MVSKIKIVSVISDLGIGGTSRQLTTIDKYLNKDFFEHYIISTNSDDKARVKFIKNNNLFFVSDPYKIVQLIEEKGIDLLFFQRHGRNELLHDKISNLLNEDVSVVELNIFSSKDYGDFGKKCGAHVFVSSINLLKYCRQNKIDFDFKKHKVMHALVDSDNFLKDVPTDLNVIDYKSKLGIKDEFVIGRIARPVMGKWDDMTILMWKKLCKINNKIKFIVYGVPDCRKKMLEKIGISNNLIMLDSTSSDYELSLFYNSIDVLVHISPIGECSSAAIDEAMLFKKPVIVNSTPFPKYTFFRSHTRDNGQLEQVTNGKNGYIVKNATAMAKAIDKLSKDSVLVKEFGNINYKKVLNNYDAKIGIKTLEKIFLESVLDKGKKLSNYILKYYDSLKFYPDKNMIDEWFEKYDKVLCDVYCIECQDTNIEKIKGSLLKVKRKLKSFISRVFNNK